MKITKRHLKKLIEQSIPDYDTTWSDADVEKHVQHFATYFGLDGTTDAKLIDEIRNELKASLQKDRSGFMGLWDDFKHSIIYTSQDKFLRNHKAITDLQDLLGGRLATKLGSKLRGTVFKGQRWWGAPHPGGGIFTTLEESNMKITKRQLNKIIKEELSHVLNEDDVGSPIFSQYHGEESDPDPMDVIYDLAMEATHFARAVENVELSDRLQELMFSIMNASQVD